MHLSRTRQLEILEILATIYPRYTSEVSRPDHQEEDLANVWYLREHELVEAHLEFTLGGTYAFAGAKITAKGMDFLADDGGLSAILRTVTVKLHADTVRELLVAKVEQSSLPSEQKGALRKHVEAMSTEALKTLTKLLVEKGIEKIPDIMQFIQTVAKTVA